MVGEFDPVFTKFWSLASLALGGSRGPLRNAGPGETFMATQWLWSTRLTIWAPNE